jgi:hypothetical protein
LTVLNSSAERNRGDTVRLGGELGVALDRHLVRLEGHGPQGPAGHLRGQPRFDEPLDDQLEIGAVALGGQRVPRIGGQHRRAAGQQQQRGVRAGQAAQVTDVRTRGDEGRIRADLGDFLPGALPARRLNLWHARTLRAQLEAGLRVIGGTPNQIG